jgi:hypothetical protein
MPYFKLGNSIEFCTSSNTQHVKNERVVFIWSKWSMHRSPRWKNISNLLLFIIFWNKGGQWLTSKTCKACLSFWRLEKHETNIYGVIPMGGKWQGKLHGLRGFSCNTTCYLGVSFHFKLSCHEVTIFDNQS